jgi:FtsZ-interacting cell division protein ZipA
MSTGMIIVVVVVIVAVLFVGLLAARLRRRQQLRERFGPEYDKAVDDGQNRRAAERELGEREKRHEQFDITPLSPAARDGYAQQWALIQAKFVDHPDTSVAEADQLVVVVMGERGYPTEDYEQQVADLSVEHASTLAHYRSAHDIKSRHDQDQVSTEELRQAMVHYRSLFEDLLDINADSRTDNVDNAGSGVNPHPGT